MVSFTSLALLGLAAAGSLAAPAEKRWSSDCMTAAEAQQVADNYAELIRSYSDELAIAALAPDFTDYSESVNSLINTCPQGKAAKAGPVPLLSASFDDRKKFMTGQGQQPAINFKQLNIEANCNFVTIRWETTNTAPIPTPRPVVGIILLQTEKAPAGNKYPWIINTVYSEFDSAAWLQNLEQWGICTATNSGSPQLALPSGTVGAPPPPSGSASTSAAPASASGYVSTSSTSTWSSSASPAASSSNTSQNNGQYSWTPTSSTASATASASATGSSSWTASTASAYTA
jgi:hypothetical protein